MERNRRLIVMRHAKSSWSEPVASDHERPLNARGRRDAPRVAKQLVEWEWEPEWVLSSDAVRTQETFAGMATVLSVSPSVAFLPTLYHASIEAVQRQIVDVPEEVQTVLLLGHNPGWEEVVWWLCGEELVLKTADAALMERRADDWPRALRGQGTWKLWNLLRSREL